MHAMISHSPSLDAQYGLLLYHLEKIFDSDCDSEVVSSVSVYARLCVKISRIKPESNRYETSSVIEVVVVF